MPDPHPLDNPIWSALTTEHASLALGDSLARRYPPAIGPLSGMASQTEAGYESLRTLAGPEGLVGLFLEQPPVPRPGWTLVRGGELCQMISTSADAADSTPLPPGVSMRRLTADDVSEMVALAELTEPGPFRNRTHELGVFYGIFDAGRLVAMAGQRMHVPGFVEVSAVCTHPDARGRGYARALMAEVMKEIRRRGETPFLHVFAENQSAMRVYEGLGYVQRRILHLAVLKNEA
ncbi:MAG TPA: GNAT family N-acetyltransferase [Terracidiphilus sp.]|nr:GNAT family N-acetyltransferase [Terracidiphilus sp.]